ncbi:DEAD/DEAH box helicase [Streptomyces sp. MP131-18]|uniref:DEAD/DEAH box helicase n=1 Tax=Streptomyces sp. MP131-18 TaxID=1857892 RepID=UPI00097C65E3|nr:DEAD/DEAH box helicase [Streptomyces sp. MP131-18]ONK13250.1 UvsW helicase [Streptomyces sp. MP131-18]
MTNTNLLRVGKKPRSHQEEALSAIRGIGPAGRALVVMACGTGKTLVGLLAALERAGDRGVVMVLVPRKALLRQTYLDWRADIPGNVDALLVFSDPPVADARATTDPTTIRTFLRNPTDRPRLLFCTYQSAARVAEAYAADPSLAALDVMILDEAHNTVGKVGGRYSRVLHDSHIPARTRLSLTATAKVHELGDGTSDAVAMDNPKLYGKRVYQLTFGTAIRHKLLSDYRVAVVLVTDAEVHQVLQQQTAASRGDRLSLAQIAAQIAVARAVEEYGLRRIIGFHGRVERSRLFTETLSRTAAGLTGVPVEALHIDAGTPAEKRLRALERLENPGRDGATVLSNVATLTEGVNVPAVDGVIFADPKTSKIAIAQAVGRALRLAPGKERPSVIVLPVYLSPDESPEQALASSDFRHVWAVLSALRDFDERLDTRLVAASQKLGERDVTGDGNVNLPDAIDLLGSGVTGHKLRDALHIHILNHTTEPWHIRYGRLRAHMRRTGRVPKNSYVTPRGDPLGRFAAAQKMAFTKGLLARERAALLEALPGWAWARPQVRYPEVDQQELDTLVLDWFKHSRDHRLDEDTRHQRKLAIARQCRKLIPGFKYSISKQRQRVNNALMEMQVYLDRVEARERRAAQERNADSG